MDAYIEWPANNTQTFWHLVDRDGKALCGQPVESTVSGDLIPKRSRVYCGHCRDKFNELEPASPTLPRESIASL